MSQPWTPPPPPQDNPPYGQLNYASWADRVLAALIDGAIVFGVVVILYIAFMIISTIIGIGSSAVSRVSDTGGALGGILSGGICCVTFVILPLASLGIGLYNKVYLVSKRGSSIGQGIMKLKVVTADGGMVPTGTLVHRLLVQIGFGFIPLLPLLSILWPLWDPQRQALHDKAVGTFVIKVE